jgi:ribose transport system permease protein
VATAREATTAADSAVATGKRPRRFNVEPKQLLPVGILILIVAIFSSLSDAYLSINNFTNIADQAAVLIIAGMGLTLVIIAGSIDLSIGAIAGLAAVVMASFAAGSGVAEGGAPINTDAGIFAALGVGVLVGAIAGFFNGGIFTWLRVPSFVVTLGLLTLGHGLQVVYTGGRPISLENQALVNLGTNETLGIPQTFWIALGATAIAVVIARYTTFGRHVYALGGSERVATMSGVPTARVKVAMFMLSGVFAAVAGMLDATRSAAGVPTAGVGLELTAIAAVVIGGTPLTGGTGGPLGTLLGALIITALNAGLNIVGVAPQWSPVITGAVLIVAVVISIDRKRIGIMK